MARKFEDTLASKTVSGKQTNEQTRNSQKPGKNPLSLPALIHLTIYLEFSILFKKHSFFSITNTGLIIRSDSKLCSKVDLTKGLLNPIIFLMLAFFIR
jgi:hypothetical protein